MVHVVSVSLGSSSGDFVRDADLGGRRVRLAREGMDSDMQRAAARIRALDGAVDAIGLGGIDITLRIGDKRLIIGDGERLAGNAHRTPVVDGSGLKDTLERRVIRDLAQQGMIRRGTRVLMVSALDRFGMAEALVDAGCECIFGDLIFNIGLDFPLTKLSEIDELSRKYESRLKTVPFHLLYPTGAAQDEAAADPRYAKYYLAADIVAGDAHLIMRHLPPAGMAGKGVVTNTTRPSTMARLSSAGASWVVTTTPEMDGVSAGTNLMEAALVALIGKPADRIVPSDYEQWTERLAWRGAYRDLQGESESHAAVR